MKQYQLPILIERDSDGYFASCPDLQGCYAQGTTYEEALANIADAVKLHIADREDVGEVVSERRDISFSTLQVVA